MWLVAHLNWVPLLVLTVTVQCAVCVVRYRLVQSRMQAVAAGDAVHEVDKPLARYRDDEDLDRLQREEEREGDPMLAFMRKKKDKADGNKTSTCWLVVKLFFLLFANSAVECLNSYLKSATIFILFCRVSRVQGTPTSSQPLQHSAGISVGWSQSVQRI